MVGVAARDSRPFRSSDARCAARPHARVVENVLHATLCFWPLISDSEFSRTDMQVVLPQYNRSGLTVACLRQVSLMWNV